jgi:hypothetical protein
MKKTASHKIVFALICSLALCQANAQSIDKKVEKATEQNKM